MRHHLLLLGTADSTHGSAEGGARKGSKVEGLWVVVVVVVVVGSQLGDYMIWGKIEEDLLGAKSCSVGRT